MPFMLHLALKVPKVRKVLANAPDHRYILRHGAANRPKFRAIKAAEVHTLAAAFFCRVWKRKLASKCLKTLLTAFCKVANSLQN